jgi:transposase
MAVTVRTFTMEGAPKLNQVAHARQAPHRLVQRVQIIWASAQGLNTPAIAQHVGLSAVWVRAWIQRCTHHGLAGLADAARSGGLRRHDQTARGTVMALARPKPQRPEWALAWRTLARVQQALLQGRGLHMTPATLWKVGQGRGLALVAPQRCFQVTGATGFAEHRRPSSRPTRRRAWRGGSLASTNSGL